MAEPFAQNLTGESGTARPRVQRWYACYTRARHEKLVERLLMQRGIECYLPLVPRLRKWKDRRKLVSMPMFPSYVFGKFGASELYQVLSVPGVATVVRSNGRLVPIKAEDLENVRRFAAGLEGTSLSLQVRPYVAEGQRVRILEGPFEGVEGVVIERRNRKRVLVGLEAIGQGLEINVDTRLLKPIPGP